MGRLGFWRLPLDRICTGIFLLAWLALANGQLQVTVHASELDQRIGMACSFLKTLYDPSLQLVRETGSKRVYHVASDNLLAWKALGGCKPDISYLNISRSIKASISRNPCCNEGNDSMHEAVFGVQIQLPLHTANEYNVTKDWPIATGNYSVLWENHNGTATLSPFAYADVAVYTTLELERRGNGTGAMEMVGVLNTMWDGKGMIDEAYKNGNVGERGIYQTFKVALYMFLLKRFSFPVPSGLTDALVRMQGPDGDFHTGYDPNLTYAGTDKNAETTSLAIIALNEQCPCQDFRYVIVVLTWSIASVILLFVLRRRQLGLTWLLGSAKPSSRNRLTTSSPHFLMLSGYSAAMLGMRMISLIRSPQDWALVSILA